MVIRGAYRTAGLHANATKENGRGTLPHIEDRVDIEASAGVGMGLRMLNHCLDDAIASAITQYGAERDAPRVRKPSTRGFA
jgi:hypothetical protein